MIKTDSPNILKQKEIFNNVVDEGCNEILTLYKKINYDDLTYNFKNKNN